MFKNKNEEIKKYEISQEAFDWTLKQISKLNLEEFEAIMAGDKVKARIWNERINRLLSVLESYKVVNK